MKDFWLSCGHHLLDRDDGGGLLVTDDFLKVYLARPELVPPPEACAAERALHAALLADPRRPVAAAEIAAIADADARENWEVMLAFRDHLTGHRTLEAAYLDICGAACKMPPLFVNQLVHVILRNALDGCEDPYVLRAAELFFRPQRMTLHDGSLIAADEETIAGTERDAGVAAGLDARPAGRSRDRRHQRRQRRPLFRAQRPVPRGARSHRRPARTRGAGAGDRALGRASARRSRSTVEPFTEVQDANLTWYVGLDAAGTRIGDALWNGEELDDARRASVVGLLPADLHAIPNVAAERVKGEPVYLILAMDADKVLRIKPQNLVTGLPIKHLEAVS